MKRRSRAGRKASKAKGRVALKTERSDASKTVSSTAPTQDAKVARLTRELREALEQQRAASEVLRVISPSTGQLDPVFQTILANATRICGANFGILNLHENGSWPPAALHNVPQAFIELRRREPMLHFGPEHPLEQVAATKRALHIADVRTTAGYKAGDPAHLTIVELAGARTALVVPMCNEGNLIGAITIYRQEVRPFSEKHIELVTNFAAQAVIAIENTRLLNELRQRTTDLTESLEQQTATANVLEIISRSAFDLRAVFETVVESSVKLCGADRAFIFRFDGELLRTAAFYNASPEFAEWVKEHPIRAGRHSGAARAALERRTIHIPDVQADPEFTYGAKDFEAVRTVLAVPILKGDDLLGVMIMNRLEVRPFSDQQIALVETFADQAAIAIENVRLLDALRQRTTDLTETLEQQTATADVLEVISRSAFDLQAVFDTVAESSVRLCGADRAFIFRFDGEFLRMAVAYNASAEFAEWVANHPIPPGRHSGSARAALERRTIHIPDVLADPEYTYGAKDVEPIRTILGVPILKGDDLLGVMMIYRLEVRPFTDKQIALVETFADQAAIAIENVRLLEELRERTNQLEAQSKEVVKLNQQLEQRVSDQVGEIERMGRLRRFLPPQVADLIVASGSEKQLESHRREITALFCDLRGFTVH
jgi:two-component system, NtrC family, sensor kinase